MSAEIPGRNKNVVSLESKKRLGTIYYQIRNICTYVYIHIAYMCMYMYVGLCVCINTCADNCVHKYMANAAEK